MLSLLILMVLLAGCRDRLVTVQNEDDGKLRIDEQHTIDFYLGSEEAGTDPIAEQCLQMMGDRKPDEVKKMEGWDSLPDEYLHTYRLNGASIRIAHSGAEMDERDVLWSIELGQNHILSSGVRIGSTEEELKKAYEGKPGFDFYGYDVDDQLRVYVLYGPWYERYLILFEVDARIGRITGIDYELDI